MASQPPFACLKPALGFSKPCFHTMYRRMDFLSTGGSPNGRATAGRHITRIQRPVPTRQHPLSGLWKGDLGRDGIHIFSISSDFSGPAARISAVQVGLAPLKPGCFPSLPRLSLLLQSAIAPMLRSGNDHLLLKGLSCQPLVKALY